VRLERSTLERVLPSGSRRFRCRPNGATRDQPGHVAQRSFARSTNLALRWPTVTATKAALAQLNTLLDECNTFKRHTGTNQQNLDADKMTYRLQAAIERLTPPSSSYRQDLDRSRGLDTPTPR
jgi:hypothetical protein